VTKPGMTENAIGRLVPRQVNGREFAAFAGVGHQDGDAVDDLIVGAPATTSGGAGAAWLLLGTRLRSARPSSRRASGRTQGRGVQTSPEGPSGAHTG